MKGNNAQALVDYNKTIELKTGLCGHIVGVRAYASGPSWLWLIVPNIN